MIALSSHGECQHEEELDNVRVEEEELSSLAALCARISLHGPTVIAGRLGEENVSQRSHLHKCISRGGLTVSSLREGKEHTKNSEFAKKV